MIVNWNGVSEPSEEQFPPVKKEKKEGQPSKQTNQNKPHIRDEQVPY